jgi:hypothetical protein
VREGLGVRDARLRGEVGDEGADLRQVVGARAVELVAAIADLEQDVDERAALEVLALEPAVEDVEDREQPLVGLASALLDLALEPVLGPALLAAREEGEHERVLGAEVAVQRHPGDAGALDDRVDPDRADAVAREQLVGRFEDALARVRGDSGLCGAGRHRLDSRREQP